MSNTTWLVEVTGNIPAKPTYVSLERCRFGGALVLVETVCVCVRADVPGQKVVVL